RFLGHCERCGHVGWTLDHSALRSALTPDMIESIQRSYTGASMSAGCGTVTSSRFERRAPPGRHDLLFKVVFSSDGEAARHYRTTRMTVWRWRHDKTPLPRWVSENLAGLIQEKVAQAHQAQFELNILLKSPLPPPRKLSGCC